MEDSGEGSGAAALDDDGLPEVFRVADSASLSGQRRTIGLTRVQLGLAVFSALAAGFGIGHGTLAKSFDIGAVALFVLSLTPAVLLHDGAAQRLWYDGRAAAESIRSVAWKYAMRATPFSDDASAERNFDERMDAIRNTFATEESQVKSGPWQGEDAITPAMKALRAAPLAVRKRVYIRARIEDQIEWYTRKAESAKRLATVAGAGVVASNLVGIGFGIARVVWDLEIDLLGFCAALVAAVAAYGQLRQYWTLAAAYELTAAELRDVRSLADETGEDEAAWVDFCGNAEIAVSREHTMWHARRR